MKYRVEITESAEADLRTAYRWVRDEHSPEEATHWLEGLLDAAATLERFPERCALAPEGRLLGRKIRQLLHGKRRAVYRMLFEVQGRVVYLLHIRHASRWRLGDPPLGDDE